MGPRPKFLTFSEYCHIVYQIKGNEVYNNMLANVIPSHSPSTPGVESKGQSMFFSESSLVAYEIKEN